MKAPALLFSLLLGACASISEPVKSTLDVTGSWKGSWRYSHFAYEEKFSFDLKQSNGSIVGTGIDEKGVGASVRGHIANNKVRLIIKPADGSDPVTFEGIAEDVLMKGSFSVGNVKGVWFAKKVRA
jgi:hypothetical protein